MAAVVLVVAVTTVAFSMLFLQVNAPVWPDGATLGTPWLSAGTGLALLVAITASWWGSRQGPLEHDATPVARTAHLAAGATTATAGTVALALAVAQWPAGGLDHTAHAYGSGVLMMVGTLALATVLGLGITVSALVARLTHSRDVRPRIMLQNAAVLWTGVLVVWAVAWTATDLLPTVVV
jgi:hypothetical protein